MYTLYDSNTLSVCSYKGMQIVRLGTYPKGKKLRKWKEGTLVMSDQGKQVRFRVWMSHNHSKAYPILLRPLEQYHNAVFEQFFGFGCHCSGFSTDVTIGVPPQPHNLV